MRRDGRPMRPKVLTLFPRAVGGGAERLVLDQMRFHQDGRLRLHGRGASQREASRPSSPPTPATRACTRGTRFNPLALARVNHLIRSRGIDVLHTHLQEADFYGYWLKRLNPRLIWISTRHNADDFRMRWFWRTLNTAISRPMQQVIAVSNSVREFVVAA